VFAPITCRRNLAQNPRLLLAVITNEVVERSFSREWIALPTLKPVPALRPTAAHAAFSDIGRRIRIELHGHNYPSSYPARRFARAAGIQRFGLLCQIWPQRV
jgi:hypothetical protein